jgi:hypothetical protein
MPFKNSNSLNFSVQMKTLPKGETIIKHAFSPKGQVLVKTWAEGLLFHIKNQTNF